MANPNFQPPPPGSGEFGAPPPPPPDVQQFVHRLGEISRHPRVIRELPDFTPQIEHRGAVPMYEGVVDGLNVHFAPDVLDKFEPRGEHALQRVDFSYKPSAGFGKEDSFRQARFGVMTFADATGRTHQERVVVKQFPMGGPKDAVPNAIQECAMLQYARQCGMQAVDLVGLVVDRYNLEHPKIYVMTRQRQELQSLDEPSWERLRVAELEERLDPLIDTLVLAHGNLLFPGDPKFKNIALGEDGQPLIFDLERSRSVRDLVADMTPENEDEVISAIVDRYEHDFLKNVNFSMNTVVYPNLPAAERPGTPAELFDFEYTHLYEPYLHKLMQSASAHKAVLRTAFTRFMQRRREELVGTTPSQ